LAGADADDADAADAASTVCNDGGFGDVKRRMRGSG
jgi:hypothetical protein